MDEMMMDDLDMDGGVSGMQGSELDMGSPSKFVARPPEVEDRQKKPTGLDQIRESAKELHEVIAYMDYSFERAFTIQEKEYMLAYKVSCLR